MIAVIALMSLSRCAVPALCPTDEQLLTALRNRDFGVVLDAAEDGPDSIVLTYPQTVTRISDVVCGGRLPSGLAGNPPVIHCKLTARYRSAEIFYIARMVLREERWEIDDAFAVSRDRR